jgi:hypothetical protein
LWASAVIDEIKTFESKPVEIVPSIHRYVDVFGLTG